MTALGKTSLGLRTLATHIAEVFFEITHNSFALLGLVVAFAVITLTVRPDLRQVGEERLITWLHDRQGALLGSSESKPDSSTEANADPEVDSVAVDRATATDPKDLPKEQAKLAYWLSKKYRVAPEPLSALVSGAYEVGQRVKLDPTLILAIMAVESSFNPFAQSAVGAQGLMQVMTHVHSDKYQDFGGKLAAFDPLTNLRVGVQVLQECISRAGSVEGGLRLYVGAGSSESDGGYAEKVMSEHARLYQVAKGRALPAAPVRKPTPVAETPTTAVTPELPARENAARADKMALAAS